MIMLWDVVKSGSYIIVIFITSIFMLLRNKFMAYDMYMYTLMLSL